MKRVLRAAVCEVASWGVATVVVAASGIASLSASCSADPRVIDPLPIAVDLGAGPVLLKAQEGEGVLFNLVVDVLSPITVIDSLQPGQPLQTPNRRRTRLSLFSATQPPVRRVRYPQATSYDLHPCSPSAAPCPIGNGDRSLTIGGVLGTDVLSQVSVRFSFPTSEMRFFPDAAGSDNSRTLSCDAVFGSPYAGSGALFVDGSEVSYVGHRPALSACLRSTTSSAMDSSPVQSGTDVQLAISTGMGTSLLSQDAYNRYAYAGNAPPLDSLPAATRYLSSGTVQGRLATIPFLALTGNIGADSDGRGPCSELYANAIMRASPSCEANTPSCPCNNGRTTCKAAAAIELSHGVEVLVVDGSVPLLQSLRDELRPQLPEIDGVLGVQAMQALQVEFDFPNNRLLMRCLALQDCITRPQVRSANSIGTLAQCRDDEQRIRDGQAQDAGVLP